MDGHFSTAPLEPSRSHVLTKYFAERCANTTGKRIRTVEEHYKRLRVMLAPETFASCKM